MSPKLEKGKPRSLPGALYNKYFKDMTLPCKTSKQKLADITAKHQEKLQKFFV